jgi:Icc-related predicted phosphoesterase
MIICHSSDQHGFQYKVDGEIVSIFPDIKENFDVFVCSGDFLSNLFWGPNKDINLLAQEKQYQEKWTHRYAQHIKQWCHNKPFLFSSGNHDFINPCKILKKYGINAIDLDDKIVEFMGYTWYGFCYVPEMGNNWNHERNAQDMHTECNRMLSRLKDAGKEDKLDILVAHVPPYGILDKVPRENIGNAQMNSILSYKIKKLPKLYCCGHVHEANGVDWLDLKNGTEPMLISNAATTYRIIDLEALDNLRTGD